jgi:hypothetical protein
MNCTPSKARSPMVLDWSSIETARRDAVLDFLKRYGQDVQVWRRLPSGDISGIVRYFDNSGDCLRLVIPAQSDDLWWHLLRSGHLSGEYIPDSDQGTGLDSLENFLKRRLSGNHTETPIPGGQGKPGTSAERPLELPVMLENRPYKPRCGRRLEDDGDGRSPRPRGSGRIYL